MTFQQFLEKYNGKAVDFDGWYGAQCMDLMHQYIYDVLGLTDKKILAAPSAKDVYLNFSNIVGSQYFEKIDNTPEGIPQEGDIVFWGYNPYGHVAIFIEGNANSFRSFDQNYPVGSLPHVQNHTYANCLGWLRSIKTINIPESLVKCQADLKDEIRKKNETWNELQETSHILEGKEAEIISYQNFVKQVATTLGDPTADQNKIIGLAKTHYEGNLSKEDSIRQLQNKNQELQNTITSLTEELKQSDETINKTANELSAVKEALQGVSRQLEEEKIKVRDLESSQKLTFKRLFWKIYYGR